MSPRGAPGAPRAPRADAAANRARILDAAEEVFGRGGESASTEDVARAAGVGIGTVFRHFPAKADLLDAVLARIFGRLRERAEELAAGDDPGAALFTMFTEMVTGAPSKIAIAEALAAEGGDGALSQAHEESAATARAVGTLLAAAQDAGAVRPDVRLRELYALLIGMSRAAALGRLGPGVQDRTLAVVFDGLRAAPPPGGPQRPEPGPPQPPGP